MYISGNSSRCKDCKYYKQFSLIDIYESKKNEDYGFCKNKKHLSTHGKGKGIVYYLQMSCFDFENKEK